MSSASPRTAPKALGLFAAGLLAATAFVSAASILPSSPAIAQNQLNGAAIDTSHGYADLVDRVMPAVVSVQVKFANAAAASDEDGAGQGQQMPGLPDGPLGEFFKQFRGQGMPGQGSLEPRLDRPIQPLYPIADRPHLLHCPLLLTSRITLAASYTTARNQPPPRIAPKAVVQTASTSSGTCLY